jgi:hypothetical protein
MPSAVKLYAYILIANISTGVIVTRWLEGFGFVASIAVGLAFAYLTIVTGRSFGRKSCEGVAAGYGPHRFYKLNLFQGDRR